MVPLMDAMDKKLIRRSLGTTPPRPSKRAKSTPSSPTLSQLSLTPTPTPSQLSLTLTPTSTPPATPVYDKPSGIKGHSLALASLPVANSCGVPVCSLVACCLLGRVMLWRVGFGSSLLRVVSLLVAMLCECLWGTVLCCCLVACCWLGRGMLWRVCFGTSLLRVVSLPVTMLCDCFVC